MKLCLRYLWFCLNQFASGRLQIRWARPSSHYVSWCKSVLCHLFLSLLEAGDVVHISISSPDEFSGTELSNKERKKKNQRHSHAEVTTPGCNSMQLCKGAHEVPSCDVGTAKWVLRTSASLDMSHLPRDLETPKSTGMWPFLLSVPLRLPPWSQICVQH